MSTDLHDLVAAYALDALPSDEATEFERHMAGCDECRGELDELRAGVIAMGESASAAPSADLRAAILAEAAATTQERPPTEPGLQDAGGHERSKWAFRWPRPAIAAAFGSLAVAAVVLLIALVVTSGEATPDEVLDDLLAATDTQTAQLVGGATSGISGRLVFSEAEGRGVLEAQGLASIGTDQTYELWLVGDTAVTPANLFSPENGSAAIVIDASFSGVLQLGLTIEPAGGSDSPTGAILAVVSLP